MPKFLNDTGAEYLSGKISDILAGGEVTYQISSASGISLPAATSTLLRTLYISSGVWLLGMNLAVTTSGSTLQVASIMDSSSTLAVSRGTDASGGGQTVVMLYTTTSSSVPIRYYAYNGRAAITNGQTKCWYVKLADSRWI